MPKKDRQPNEHEALVAQFSRRSISAGATFHPQQWSNGREPADMVISLGRSLLLFNMTDSGSYLEQLIDHNVSQARDRLNEWRDSGRQIRGKSPARDFALSWDDVDHVAIISVVDGRYAACATVSYPEPAQSKVRACFAVTSEFLRTFASLGGAARDLLRFAKMHLTETPMPTERAIAALRAYYEILKVNSGAGTLPEPQRLGRAVIRGKRISWFDEMCSNLIAPRTADGDWMFYFADYSWAEIFAAVAFIIASIGQMEALPDGQIRADVVGTQAKMLVVCSTNMKALGEQTPTLVEFARENGCALMYYLSAVPMGLVPMFTVLTPPGTWAVDADLENWTK